MNKYGYTFNFMGMKHGSYSVEMFDHMNGVRSWPQIAVDKTSLRERNLPYIPTQVADIFDLGMAVALADRLSKRSKQAPARYQIQIILPVRNPELYDRTEVLDQLQAVLRWYTEDDWSFRFLRHPETEYAVDQQYTLSLSPGETEVALWSGGLDSLVGLYNRLNIAPAMNYTLVGTGSNTHAHKVQHSLLQFMENRIRTRVKFFQLPIRLRETGALLKSSSGRTRGFVFLLFGAACAYLEAQTTLSIYENGIGAINLPYLPLQVGVDHSHAVHPLSLLEMSTLVSHLLGSSFEFQNPFLYQTKAQMCEIISQSGIHTLVAQTISCDRPHRTSPIQCGYCSSCLLRRQALAVNDIFEDPNRYVLTAGQRVYRLSDSDHLIAMQYQINTLRSIFASTSSDPWMAFLDHYPILVEVAARLAEWNKVPLRLIERSLLELYRQYVNEWNEVQPFLEVGLLHRYQIHTAA